MKQIISNLMEELTDKAYIEYEKTSLHSYEQEKERLLGMLKHNKTIDFEHESGVMGDRKGDYLYRKGFKDCIVFIKVI